MARISKLRIQNYRSIAGPLEIDFPVNTPVILLGENNAGKSNIVRSLDLVLGEFWPKSHDPEDHEFYGRQRTVPISIELQFDPQDPFGGCHQRVLWTHDPGRESEPTQYVGNGTAWIKNDHRDSCFCITVGAERDLSHHLSYRSKWTYLSRLMRRFHKVLNDQGETKSELEELFGSIKAKFHDVGPFADFVTSLQSDFDDLSATMTHRLMVDFEAYNPTNFFHALRLHAVEGKLSRTLDELGTGEQQVLAIAFAHAYARAFHSGILLVIEEPEAHLHPLMQKWLARKVRQLASGGLQIVITTHSPAFLRILDLDGMVLVRKTDKGTTCEQRSARTLAAHCEATGVPTGRADVSSILPFYFANCTDDHLNGFFAKRIVLVEGPTEALALPYYLYKVGLDVYKDGIAIVPVGGKGNLAKWWRLYTHYGIPTYVIFDNDSKDDDASGTKRTDILCALGKSAAQVAACLAASDWLIDQDVAVFGIDFESTLRSNFTEYSGREEVARREVGSSSKPFIARQVARNLDLPENEAGTEHLRRLAKAIAGQLPAEDDDIPF